MSVHTLIRLEWNKKGKAVGSRQRVRETVNYRDYGGPWITEEHKQFGNSLHAHREIFIHVMRHISTSRQSIAWSNGISCDWQWLLTVATSDAQYFGEARKLRLHHPSHADTHRKFAPQLTKWEDGGGHSRASLLLALLFPSNKAVILRQRHT